MLTKIRLFLPVVSLIPEEEQDQFVQELASEYLRLCRERGEMGLSGFGKDLPKLLTVVLKKRDQET